MKEKIADAVLEEYFVSIIQGKESIRSIAANSKIPRTTLTRMIDEKYRNDSRYFRYKVRLEQNQHSGGNILEQEMVDTYGNEEELRKFFEEYCEYKTKKVNDSEIIKQMGLSKATFYRKLKAYKIILAQGIVQLKRTEFEKLPNYLKEEIIFGKANDRRNKANIKRISKSDFSENLVQIKEFLLYERNQNIKDEKHRISLEDLYYLLYTNVSLIATTTVERTIRPHMENIDKIIGNDLTNLMLKNKPYILSSSKKTVEQLLCIAIDYEILEKYVTANERMSPERLYALIKFSKEKGIEENSLGEIDKKAMKDYTKEELLEMYPLPEEYRIIGEKQIQQQDEEINL